MSRIVVVTLFIALLFCGHVRSQLTVVDPPIMQIATGGDNNGKSNMKYDVKIRKYTVVRVPETPPSTTTEISTTTTTPPPDLDVNHIEVQTRSTFEENLLEEDHDCAFTFTLPNPRPSNQQVCVRDVRALMTSYPEERRSGDEEALNTLRNEISLWQESMGDLKTQIEERLAVPSLEPVRNDVRLLQKESRNMNFRISQLYMQLLHEIIRKRDDTIEYTSVENSVMNVTIKYYELKEKHEALVTDHKALKQQSQSQQEQIKILQTKMEEMVHRMNRMAVDIQLMGIDDEKDEVNDTANSSLSESRSSYTNCVDIQLYASKESGIYILTLPSLSRKMKVWCDFEQDPGGWTVIQRRSEGKVNFYRNFASYQRGFGSLEGEFWLGLENIHHLTNQPGVNYKLHIDMEDWSGRKTFVEYGSFKLEGQDEGYRLKVAHYSGTAGDSLTWHNNMKFTTKNVDNDPFARNCANYQKGGWWYNTCAHSNLNGVYYMGGHYRSKFQDGIYWSEWRGGSYSLKHVEMKIKPSE
uniref:angiopoietin-related protein 2-like n=1 Tax=Styela clava TaxID=7725 RepID=UPI001939B50E|nr:angiopoietin-related protein 2-like [Styela clava]